MTGTVPAGPVNSGVVGRYADDLIAVHDRISLRDIAARAEPGSVLHLARRPDGLVVLAVRGAGLPPRYQLAIRGFRLAQYLRLNFASQDIAHRRALFAEPVAGPVDELHVLALDRAGTIQRYLALVGPLDPAPMALRDPGRARFPCEQVHRVNLFDHVAVDPTVDSWGVREVKRLVARPEPAGARPVSLAGRARLTLELALGFYTALSRLERPLRVLVGEGEERVAIIRLLRSLPEITVVEGTTPGVPGDDLLHPRYAVAAREPVKPFVAPVPVGAELERVIADLRRALHSPHPLLGFRDLVRDVGGQLRRVRI